MYLKYLLLLSPILLASCVFTGDSVPQSAPTTPVVPNVVTMETVNVGTKEVKNYTLKLVDNKGSLKINHGTGSRLVLSFESPANKALKVDLTTPKDPKGNIRVTQIILPNKQADGPFDRNMKYTLTQSGEYQIIIGENMMAGDPWSGEVELKMSLK